jgi:hypothetical protein
MRSQQICSAITWALVVPAKAGTHGRRLWNTGPRFRGDEYTNLLISLA